MQFTAYINEEGEVVPYEDHPRLFKSKLEQWLKDKAPGRLVTVSIQPNYTDKRSSQQNKWLWGPCYSAIVMYLWEKWGVEYTPATVHKYMLKKLAPKRDYTVVLNGVSYITTDPVRSSRMTVQEFTQYMDALICYWGERGLEIPLPDNNDATRFSSL